MNLLLNITNINEKYIFFNEPIENNILMNGKFIKILYSNPEINLTNIITKLIFNNIGINKIYNKIIYTIPYVLNSHMIDKIHNIEDMILKKFQSMYNIKSTIIYSTKEQFKHQQIKLYYKDNINYLNKNIIILKISGIWSYNNEIGIIYKFLPYDLNQ